MLHIDFRSVTSHTQKVNFRSKHKRQSAEVLSYDDEKDFNSFHGGSSMKMKSAIKDDETSAGGQFSVNYQDSGVRRIERKMDRLEDLVWKLYEELDGKIQDLFDDHSNKFKQQNDIITNIFHGFGQEINNLKDEMQLQKPHVPVDADFVPQTQETPDEEMETSQDHFRQDSLEDEHRLVQYMTTNEDKPRKDTLEEVIEEVSKGKFKCE
jgi:hypothetical protein